MLAERGAVGPSFGLDNRRDVLFELVCPLLVYAEAVRAAGSIILCELRLLTTARRLAGL